jgi:hypothetical protein
VAGRTYRLIVEGELSDDLLPALPGVTLGRHDRTTTLTAFIRDQAELQGLLQRVVQLGLTLLEAKSVEDEPGRGTVAAPHRSELRSRTPSPS